MAQLPLYSPADLSHITDCTLKYSFFQQLGDVPLSLTAQVGPLETVILQTIQHLHAAGGPFRLNLPTTLRILGQFMTDLNLDNPDGYMTARQMIATYHRQLKADWVNVIASNELMALTIRLQRTALQVEDVIDRVDKAADGGITGLKFILSPDPASLPLVDGNVENTILHALIAATYPGRRPVRLKYWWLYQDRTETIELTETLFRENLVKMKSRVQTWLEGEVLARPGTYCEACPFQYQGCPLFYNEASPLDQAESESDLS